MTLQYNKKIKDLRLKKGFKQGDLANKLGISRPSYISFEQGEIELKFSKMLKLSEILGFSLEEIKAGLKPDYEKYKQMIIAYIRKSSAKDGKILKTKLAKMLYLADFAWFYENLNSMSGMQYRRLEHGPIPNIYFRALDELEANGSIKIDHKSEMFLISENRGSQRKKLDKLNEKELELISRISKKWKNKKTEEIVNFTHNQLPYKICLPDEIIPYELITQEDPKYVY